MMRHSPILLTLGAAALLSGCIRPCPCSQRTALAEPARGSVRIALFNIRELGSQVIRDVDPETGRGRNPQGLAAAEIVAAVRPDVLIIQEIDHDYTAPDARLAALTEAFRDAYLAAQDERWNAAECYVAPNNTGIPSGFDLDGDGRSSTLDDRGTNGYGNDCWGFGNYPGQYSMAVLARPGLLDRESARTFANFLWKDLPANQMPTNYYPGSIQNVLRLSSKSHWDLPILIDGEQVHLLISHPTPQGFDGPEDRNGRRNFDEIRMWREYIDGTGAVVDDVGNGAGLLPQARFVVAGDLNASPGDSTRYGDSTAIGQLLNHPRIQDTGPVLRSDGALRGRSAGPPDYPERNTFGSGNGRRIDYLLPSTNVRVTGGGVYWPSADVDPWGAILAETASDHRLLWIDIAIGD